MAPVIPNPKKIKGFRTESAFETWLAANHDLEAELWLKIHKKASGLATVTYAQALDVALCWGWIDGICKTFDERSFLQRFTPRRAKSVWSQINREHIARLMAAARMTPHGLRHVDAAKADGRWDAATLRFAARPWPRCRKIFAPLLKQTHAHGKHSRPSAAKTFSHWRFEPIT